MATESHYSDLLKHPKWRRKSNEICHAANWRCENCNSEDKMLTVHHTHYIKGNKPWDYPNELLICLCMECHKERAEIEDACKMEMMKALRRYANPRVKDVFWEIMERATQEMNNYE